MNYRHCFYQIGYIISTPITVTYLFLICELVYIGKPFPLHNLLYVKIEVHRIIRYKEHYYVRIREALTLC